MSASGWGRRLRLRGRPPRPPTAPTEPLIGSDLSRVSSGHTATLDQGRTQATLSRRLGSIGGLAQPPRGSALPHDELVIDFDEALREADVTGHLRVRIGDDAVAGRIALEPVDGFVVRAVFQPDRFLPFDADLELDLGQLTDVAGNRLSDELNTLEVIEDPGAPGDNLGFESGLTGWLALEKASIEASVDGLAPAEGAAQAVLGVEGLLAAMIDLPADATELELSITLLHRRVSERAGPPHREPRGHRRWSDRPGGPDLQPAVGRRGRVGRPPRRRPGALIARGQGRC